MATPLRDYRAASSHRRATGACQLHMGSTTPGHYARHQNLAQVSSGCRGVAFGTGRAEVLQGSNKHLQTEGRAGRRGGDIHRHLCLVCQGCRSGFLKPTKKNENSTTSDSKSLSAATRKLNSVKQREKQPLLDSASSNSVQGKRNKATELEKPKRLKTKIRVQSLYFFYPVHCYLTLVAGEVLLPHTCC